MFIQAFVARVVEKAAKDVPVPVGTAGESWLTNGNP